MVVVDILGAGSRPILASRLSTKVTASTLTAGEDGSKMGWLAQCLGRKLGWYTVKTEIIGHGARMSRISPSGLGRKHHEKTLFQPSLETHTLLGEDTPAS